MHFLDAWTVLPPLDLAAHAFPVALMVVVILLPGRHVAIAASLLIALLMLATWDLGPLLVRVGWCIVWLLVAVLLERPRGPVPASVLPRPGGFESGSVGLPLGAVLLVILVVAIGRQDLQPEFTRRATLGLVLVVAGLVHLMLRRDALRAVVSFAALGLGLQWLERGVREATLEGRGFSAGYVLLATTVAIVLAARTAGVRERDAGTAWVSHAHDLHD